MSVANVAVILPEIAAYVLPGITSFAHFRSLGVATERMGAPESWLGFPVADLSTVVAPGLLGLFGVPLFGIFGTLILFMFLASAFGGRSRDHGNPSGLGLVIAFMVLFIIMLALNVAFR